MDIIQIFSTVSGMAAVSRFGMTRLAVPENVLEHTGAVMIMCALITTELNSTHEAPLDLETVLMRAMLHDMDELVTGDVARPVKYESTESITFFDKIKTTAIGRVLRSLHCSERTLEDLDTHYLLQKNGREGLVVATVDILAVVYKVWDEVLIHSNRAILRQASRVEETLYGLNKKVRDTFINCPEQEFYLLNLLNEAIVIMRSANAQSGPYLGIIMEEQQ